MLPFPILRAHFCRPHISLLAQVEEMQNIRCANVHDVYALYARLERIRDVLDGCRQASGEVWGLARLAKALAPVMNESPRMFIVCRWRCAPRIDSSVRVSKF